RFGGRSLAATLPQDGGRSVAGGPVTRQGGREKTPTNQDAAASGRELAGQIGGARGPRKVEGKASQSHRTPRRGRRPGGFHARPLLHLDPHSREPSPRSRRAQAAAGDARPG